MSGPPFSCPPEIVELMTVSVLWESFQGFSGHAEPSYAAPVVLKCWQEPHGMMADTGLSVHRRADETVLEPIWDMFFSGDDPNAQTIKVYDRFTPAGVGSDSTQKLQATHVVTLYGPPFDNTNPILIQVAT